MYKILEITSPDDKLLTECLHLMWDTQGINVCSLESLKQTAGSPDSCLLMAFDQERLIGGAIAKVLDGGFEYYGVFDSLMPERMKKSRVGSLSMMGIHADYQGQGLGQKLSMRRMEWLNQKGCQLYVGISWVSGLAHTSDRVFEKLGFRAVNTVPDFFAASSIPMHLICPVCGDPPCLCPATMYLKEG